MEMTTQSEISIDIVKKTPFNPQEIIALKDKNDFELNVISAYQSLQNQSNQSNTTINISNQNNSNSNNNSIAINATLRYLILATEAMQKKEQKVILNTNILNKLNRISSHGICYQIHIGKIYIALLEQKEMILSLQSPLIISFINQVLNLVALIRTTSIEYELENKANEFIIELTNGNKLNQEQLESLRQFTIENPINIHKAKSRQIDFTSFQAMLMSLNNIIKKINSNEEQYLLFINNSDGFIQMINKASVNDNDFHAYYVEYGNFLLYLFYCNEAILLYHTEQDNDYPNVISYANFNENDLSFINRVAFNVITNSIIQSLKRQLIPLAIAYIERFSTCEKVFECLLVCFVLLRRLYSLFPDQHNKLAHLLVKVTFSLCAFKQEQSEECRLLIKNIIDYSGDSDYMIELKQLFIQKEEELRDNTEYELKCVNEIKRDKPFGIDGIYILDYDIKLGFFNCIEVIAGESFNYYIEIDHPYSLVEFGFLLENYDIDVFFYFSSFNAKPNSFTLFKHFERIDQFDTPKKLLLFLNEPGMIKVTFDNSFSWINSKEIRYTANVLKPSNTFEITQKIAIENLSILINNEDNINLLSTHLNKVVSFTFDGYTREYNIGRLYNNIMKYKRMIQSKVINPTLSLFIKDNIFWELNKEKERRELNQESFDEMISQSMIDKDKLTIVNLMNMTNEDKAKTNEIEELLKFTPKYIGEHLIYVKGNYTHCSIIYHIEQSVIENKKISNIILYIHCSEFELQLCLYHNDVIIQKNDELNIINSHTSINKQAQIIIDYINSNIIINKAKEDNYNDKKEAFEILLSGNESKTKELSALFNQENWSNSFESIAISIKKQSFVEEVIKESPFYLFMD